MTTPDSQTVLTQLVRGGAHAMRNSIATVRSVVQLTDHTDVRDALAEAASMLQISIERSIAAATIEAHAVPAHIDIDLQVLVDLAQRRAAREAGAPLARGAHVTGESVDVNTAAPLLERLLVDLLHGTSQPIDVRVNASEVSITASLPTDVVESLGPYLCAVAQASGCDVELAADHVLVCVPRSAG